MHKNNWVIIVFIILLSGCCKDEPYINPYFKENYNDILANHLNFDCEDLIADNYMKATINGQQACYYDGHDGYFMDFAFTNKFSTSSPSTLGTISNARQGCHITIRPVQRAIGEKYLFFSFPDFNLSVDPIHYLDSLWAISDHSVLGVEDIKEDPNLDFVQNAFIKSGGGILKKILIELYIQDDTTGNNFIISSVFGSQKDSFLKIKKVRKTTNIDGVFYDLVFDFKCSLYHWPQYGKQGLWGTVENGTFVAKIRAQ